MGGPPSPRDPTLESEFGVAKHTQGYSSWLKCGTTNKKGAFLTAEASASKENDNSEEREFFIGEHRIFEGDYIRTIVREKTTKLLKVIAAR